MKGIAVISNVRCTGLAVSRWLQGLFPDAFVRAPVSLPEYESVATNFDVILVDASSVNANELHQRAPAIVGHLAVLGLRVENRQTIIKWAENGATVFIKADADELEVREALVRAGKGEVSWPPEFAVVIVHGAGIAHDGSAASRPSKLTRREAEIVALIDQGMSNKEIAAALAISPATVKNHVHSILKHLHARGRVEAARITRL